MSVSILFNGGKDKLLLRALSAFSFKSVDLIFPLRYPLESGPCAKCLPNEKLIYVNLEEQIGVDLADMSKWWINRELETEVLFRYQLNVLG